MKSSTVKLLSRILAATVADWNKDNFEESKVKRTSKGRFAKGNGGGVTVKLSSKEIDNDNHQQIKDFVGKVRANCNVYGSMTADPIGWEDIDRNRYINKILISLEDDNIDDLKKVVDEWNANGKVAELIPSDDVAYTAKVNLYNKNQINNYLDDVTEYWQKTRLPSIQQECDNNTEYYTENEPDYYKDEIKQEKKQLSLIKNGKQTEHFIREGQEYPFLLLDYIKELKKQGVTDQELMLTYVFTLHPTSIRMGGNSPKEVFEPERELCQQMAQTLETFIDKAPKWQGGELLRGCHIKRDALQQMLNQQDINMRGISSWSTSADIASDFANNNGGGLDEGEVPVIFHLEKTSHGTSIAPFSQFTREEEVMVSGKSKFKAVKVEDNINPFVDDGSAIHVYLKEVK